MSNYNNRTYNKDTIQELSFGAFILKTSTIKTPLDTEYKISMIFEKNLKRKQKLDKKTFLKFSRKLNRKYEEQKGRYDKYFQSIEFFRFLFDFKRSNPFTQFCDRDIIYDIKSKIRLTMLQSQTPLIKKKGQVLRRKFGSEMNMMIRSDNSKLLGSFVLQRDASKEDPSLIAGTRTSNQVISSFSGINFKQFIEDNHENSPVLEQNSAPSSSSSSSSSSSENEDNQNENDQNPSLNMLNDFLSQQHSFQTVGLNKTTGIQNISKDFQAIKGSSEQSGNISFQNPVQEELKFQQDMNEYKHSLYDMANDTIVTISSIQEFDKDKDWLSRQVAYDSSDQSDGNRTIKDLAINIQIGIPTPMTSQVKTRETTVKNTNKRPSFRIHDNSQAILYQPKNQKRPSIRITVIPDTNLSSLIPPRRQSMMVGSGLTGLTGFNTQLMFEISPSTTSKRPSFRLMENTDMQSNESPKHLQKQFRGIQEKVKEEEEDEYIEEIKIQNQIDRNQDIVVKDLSSS
ncbi:UNKNOWN [Stylonychia lemnae]|uniref:Uncharacterized protein n=1 Tax=Stylonychia lemnae TaxID=5949 RepID=A0A078B8Y0_STYLE|nr:UNKNOWN [Stylonychia lemnae]|eukprot:CDW90950.1 UNKNOWN [Stylonychia lemnae]